MRKAAGIMLIGLGLYVIGSYLIWIPREVLIHLSYHLSYVPFPELLGMILYIVAAAFLITGGIFCLSKQYWGVCLASASFAVFFVVFNIVYLLDLYPFYWESSLSHYIYTSWPIWLMLVGAVILVIFISYRRKEWQEF